MTNPVNDAIAAAKAAAAASKSNTEVIEMAKDPNIPQGQVAVYTQAMPATLDTLVNAGLNVDEWLKAPGGGFNIGSNATPVSEIIVEMSLQDITVFHGVRFGNPATYFKSFDGITCVQGGTWAEALNRAKLADPQCKGAYVGADLTMVVAEDVVVNGVVIAEKGKVLGHSTSPTGGKTVAGFIKAVQKEAVKDAGYLTETLLVKLKHKQRTKAGVAPWGVIEMELIGFAEDGSEG